MKKDNLKKVIKFLESNGKITIDEAINKLKLQSIEAAQIFGLLIENDDVIDLSSKLGNEIAKKKNSQYQSLSNIPKPNNIIYRLGKNPIIQIMSIIVVIYSFLKIIEIVFSCDIPKI